MRYILFKQKQNTLSVALEVSVGGANLLD
ncbi:hypothetical protein SPHINGO391_70008 [Sphingomonas aurantiaca]|uniref:Uncharacterized protein n=1 Tax=Sphingomonas aurantiaca TaxID=185949 RepID=A0A5E8AML3_9SPHN|nr:hypothetical protein SPHINGO391_70008 [Sphingomonas aurantiaca]